MLASQILSCQRWYVPCLYPYSSAPIEPTSSPVRSTIWMIQSTSASSKTIAWVVWRLKPICMVWGVHVATSHRSLRCFTHKRNRVEPNIPGPMYIRNIIYPPTDIILLSSGVPVHSRPGSGRSLGVDCCCSCCFCLGTSQIPF